MLDFVIILVVNAEISAVLFTDDTEALRFLLAESDIGGDV